LLGFALAAIPMKALVYVLANRIAAHREAILV